MTTLTYQNLIDNPELIGRLERQARRERAAAFHRLVVRPVKALFAQRPLRESRMLRRSAYCG